MYPTVPSQLAGVDGAGFCVEVTEERGLDFRDLVECNETGGCDVFVEPRDRVARPEGRDVTRVEVFVGALRVLAGLPVKQPLS